MHDSRLDPGYAIAYQCEPTPGRHTISCYLYAGLFGVKKLFPELKRRIRQTGSKRSRDVLLYAAGSYYMQLVNSCGMCLFGAMTSLLPVIEWMNAATGWDLSSGEYLKTGECILNLRKAFNVREGIRPDDHRLSDRAIGKTPLAKGPLKGKTIDMDGLMRDFFDTVGWDMATGGPTDEKMRELGIDPLPQRSRA
jgi:aldehyde:ferredoxin oxidoreductase